MSEGERFRGPSAGAAILFLALTALARADVIELTDGRRYEGKITTLDDRHVIIDTKILEVRVQVGFPRGEVATISEKPLDPAFFDPPKAEARVSDPKKFNRDQAVYLDVPIIGEIGKEVYAAGISSVIQYAKSHGIPHVVFMVDSVDGDLDEGVAIYRLLRSNRQGLQLHAIIRRCRGPALALAVWCNSIHLLPGGVIGGLDEAPKSVVAKTSSKEVSEEEAAEQDRILRAQIANRVISDTGRKGVAAQLARALLDPYLALAVWRDGEGQIEFGPSAPAGTAREKVILEVPEGKFLELNADQLAALGAPKFQGEAKDLGEFLKLKGWTRESDYGERTMARVAEERQKKAQAKEAAFEAKVRKNVTRREETKEYLGNCIQQAAQWDPRKGEYEKYSQYWGWDNWGWSAAHWTEESQSKWRTRTDATAYYLREAAKTLKALKPLDAEAVKLGLEPTFKAGEIDTMLKDLDIKYQALLSQRGRKSN